MKLVNLFPLVAVALIVGSTGCKRSLENQVVESLPFKDGKTANFSFYLLVDKTFGHQNKHLEKIEIEEAPIFDPAEIAKIELTKQPSAFNRWDAIAQALRHPLEYLKRPFKLTGEPDAYFVAIDLTPRGAMILEEVTAKNVRNYMALATRSGRVLREPALIYEKIPGGKLDLSPGRSSEDDSGRTEATATFHALVEAK